jgi:hypothetical protein
MKYVGACEISQDLGNKVGRFCRKNKITQRSFFSNVVGFYLNDLDSFPTNKLKKNGNINYQKTTKLVQIPKDIYDSFVELRDSVEVPACQLISCMVNDYLKRQTT